MSRSDVIINMRGLNSVIVSDDRTTVAVGGGALNDEFVDAAYDAGVQVREYTFPSIFSVLIDFFRVES